MPELKQDRRQSNPLGLISIINNYDDQGCYYYYYYHSYDNFNNCY